MKKVLVLLLIAIFTVGLFGCQQTSEVSETGGNGDDVIKIGLFQPLTGPSSLMGTAGYNSAKLAVEEINEAGGILGKKVELIPYDDKSSPEEAVKAVTRMIEVDEVDAIIGSLHSGNIQAAGDILEEAQIPLMGTGTSPQWLEQGGHIFSVVH